MLPKQPEFEGRQVVTLHNQRDFIFFRRHRYVFRDGTLSRSPNCLYPTFSFLFFLFPIPGKGLMVVEKVGLQELGPRFTMKLLWIKRGIAGSGEESKISMDGKETGNGEVEWAWKPELETSRRKFFL